MPHNRKRTAAHCSICGKRFTMQTTDYKKRLAANIDGKIYCCHACYYNRNKVGATA